MSELVEIIDTHHDLALRALAVERDGVDNPRKDLRKWSDFRPAYGFFFADLFTPVTDPADERLGGLDPQLVQAFLGDFADSYQPLADGGEWFDQIRQLAAKHGFAPNAKEHKKTPAPTPAPSAKPHSSSASASPAPPAAPTSTPSPPPSAPTKSNAASAHSPPEPAAAT